LDYSSAKAAQAVGTTKNNVRRWKTELVRLRRENKEIRLEKETLRKASAFFAKKMK
jgi:transposase